MKCKHGKEIREGSLPCLACAAKLPATPNFSEAPKEVKEQRTIDAYALLRLVHASQNLQNLYPDFRDDPSDEDRAAWKELNEATLVVASQMGI